MHHAADPGPVYRSGTHRAGFCTGIHGTATQKVDRVRDRDPRHQDTFGMTRTVALFAKCIELFHQHFTVRSDQEGGKRVITGGA